MINPALVIALVVLGWGSAAIAMLWGLLRVLRHHYQDVSPLPKGRPSPCCSEPHKAEISLSA
ncbi:hypothetical protein [Stutzerimonas chloritidismutans]|uniref:hypothetical protein n=1 Tax=Stutzerimonas chloritidismutans TaxID=203192 RepID=UPI003F1809D1